MKFSFFILAFICGRIYMLADSYLGTKIIHAFGIHILLFSVLCYMVYTIPYKELERKLFWLLFAVYELCAMVMYAFVQYKVLHQYTQEFLLSSWGALNKSGAAKISYVLKDIQDFGIPLLMCFLFYIIYYKLKKLDLKNSDKVNNIDTFIVFRYPNNLLGLIISIFWKYPVSTIFVYSKGYKYGFNHKTKSFIKEQYQIKHKSNYFFKKISGDIEPKLNKYIGTKWGFRINCLNIYKKILGDSYEL